MLLMYVVQIFIFSYLALTYISSGQSWLSTNGKAIVNANGDTVILKAMNLGGWMLIEPYQIQAAGFASAQWEFEEKVEQLIGTAAKDTFLNNWYANHVRKVDIDSLASWGLIQSDYPCITIFLPYPFKKNLYKDKILGLQRALK